MEYNRFEKARIVGARALQISMGAPVLFELDDVGRNPVDVALMEFEMGLIPITVQRLVAPKRRE